jgi:manganese/zinc/iron transport system substrate-binding protein
VEADPPNAETYRANAEQYLAEIAATDEYVKEQIALIPEERRIMITAHDAFGYFARAYGLEVRGLQGISTESEASTADVQELASYIVERQVPAVFVETSVSPRTIESVQAAVRDQGFEVGIGGSLFSDALGEAGHEAETYNGMLRYNARILAEALGN